MRLPKLLIVGAMKSGTTGVFFDLCRHPQVFEQDNKEPHCLCYDRVLTAAGRDQYAAVFDGAEDDQLLCDASTGYTKRPDHTGVVERAVQVLPDDFRVVYVVRDPIERIVSHHFHEYMEGNMPADINVAVREIPRLVQYSRYGYQISPWLEALGPERVRIVRFEDYKADRFGVASDLCDWLGLDAALLPPPGNTVHNQAAGKPQITSFWKSVQKSFLYSRVFRPLVGVRARNALQRWLLPSPPPRPDPPSEETRQWLREQLAEEVALITQASGRTAPLWEGYTVSGESPAPLAAQ